ncbi:MAG: hypothetical protein LBQ55_10275, partial [Treponema sp.]|nr:hypothetical protein [Treponema sp.]
YPNEYTRTYAGGLLRGQGTEHVDHITGASVSYRSFLRLAAAAVENARMGRTTVSHIPLVKTAGDGGDAPAVR